MNTRYGQRLKALRERLSLTQEQAARMLNLPHRQTLTSIEAGCRPLSAEELLRATEVFQVPLEYFTDRFGVHGEAQFSWRRYNDVSQADIAAFEMRVGRLFGAYRIMSGSVGIEYRRRTQPLEMDRNTPPEEALRVGEHFSVSLACGDQVATWLVDAVEDTFGIPVINLDAPKNLSGAVCHLEDMDGIVVNRSEPIGRRNFDVAHELFHALTWLKMPPEHIEAASDEPKVGRPNIIENLADNFASGLLMPTKKLEKIHGWNNLPSEHDALVVWLNSAATHMGVSSMALVRRMATMGKLDEPTRKQMNRSPGIRHNGAAEAPPPPLSFGRKFVQILVSAMDDGRISARAASKLVGMDIDSFGDLCENYGFERSTV